jgi:AraC family transcriptional regulator of adaptative response/methylated-DNA-[protein]-cysteine methyltransferase
MSPQLAWHEHPIQFDVVKRLRAKDKQHTQIVYGYGETWFGKYLVGFSPLGLCWFEPEPGPDSISGFQQHWAPATLVHDDSQTLQKLQTIFDHPEQTHGLHLCGTDYQLRVWAALLDIPYGSRVTYGGLASLLGDGKGARALGNAVAANRVGLLVPCHRVLPASGRIGGYRWGQNLKAILLEQEAKSNLLAG